MSNIVPCALLSHDDYIMWTLHRLFLNQLKEKPRKLQHLPPRNKRKFPSLNQSPLKKVSRTTNLTYGIITSSHCCLQFHVLCHLHGNCCNCVLILFCRGEWWCRALRGRGENIQYFSLECRTASIVCRFELKCILVVLITC